MKELFLCQFILAIISMVLLWAEGRNLKERYIGMIYAIVLLTGMIPVIGVFLSLTLCIECVSNIRKQR